jgi:hypothetical protein
MCSKAGLLALTHETCHRKVHRVKEAYIKFGHPGSLQALINMLSQLRFTCFICLSFFSFSQAHLQLHICFKIKENLFLMDG